MWQRIKSIVDERVIRPLRESHAPIEELAMGSVVGMFWAFTPLVGVQMPLVTVTWFLLKPFRVRFNLPVAIAWVWVSNPVTMPLMYYSFYLAGIVIYEVAGFHRVALSFDAVKKVINDANNMPVLEGVVHWTEFMLESMGWPMMIGCTVFAVPLAIITYPITKRMVNDYRRRKALGMGLALEEWEARYVHKTVPIGEAPRREMDGIPIAPGANVPVPVNATAAGATDPLPTAEKRPRNKSRKSNSRSKKSKNNAAAGGKKTARPAKKAAKKKTAQNKSGRKNNRAAFKQGPATA